MDLEIKRAIGCLGGTPYLIISTDDEELKNRFISELSKHTKVLIDYSFIGIGECKIKEELIDNDILLLNFNEKIDEYRIFQMKNCEGISDEFGKFECYALDKFREYFYQSGKFHTIVVIGEGDLSKKMWYLPDVKSVSIIFPLNTMKQMENNKSMVLK